MWKIIFSLIIGMLLGYFFREKTKINLEKVVSAIALILIFLIGFRVSSNGLLFLAGYTYQAFIVAIFSIILSFIFALLFEGEYR
ncbi:MAG: hypothetical protein DRJ47_05640 [Thermoprotei archaeon]|nr:MAG: hypothetical protein DRJ47_05640 [Thermoprotei archaeon]